MSTGSGREVRFPSENFLTELAKAQGRQGELPSLYGHHPATRAALRVIYQNVSAVPLDVWTGPFGRPRRLATGRDADALRKLLRRPNPDHSGRDVIKLACIYSVLDGEANFVFRDSVGEPLTTNDQRPQFVTIHPKSELHRERGRWELREPGEEKIALQRAAFTRVLDPDPDDRVRGDGCRRALQMLGETDWFIRTYLRTFFKRGADPGGVLVSQLGMSRKQVDQLLKEWEQRHGGPDKANRPAVLHGGVRYEVPTQKHIDMELRATLVGIRDDSLMTIGVPESEVALTSDQTYSNGLTANAGLWVQRLLPLMLDFGEAFNDPVWGLAQRYGTGLYIDFDLALVREVLKHVASKVDALQKAVQSGVPINVAIEFLGIDIDPIEGGDEPLVNAGLVPLADLLAGRAGAFAEPDEPEDSDGDEGNDPPVEGEKSLRAGAAAVPLPGTRAAKAVRRVDRARARAARAADRAIRGVLDEYRHDVLARLDELQEGYEPRGFRALPDPSSFLPDLAKFLAAIDDAMTPVFEDAVMEAAATVEAERGTDLAVVDPQHPQIQSFVSRMRNNIKSVPEDVAARVRETVVASIDANETFDELRARLRDQFALETRHARLIAQQEGGEAVNGGRFETMALEGVTQHEWSAQLDAGTRPSHAAVDGEVRPIGERFSNGLLYPNDPAAPADEVCGCRCVALAAD